MGPDTFDPMTLIRAFSLAGILTVGAAGSLPAQAADPRSARVDSLFASLDGTASPGCAVGVVQNARFLHRRGYGMADLERRVAITPSTVFYTGSVSKQFTAMTIALLARDGRLSLDDPARKYVPEIPEAGAGITIRHMVHHQSGLREKWDLLLLSGFRQSNLVTQDDVLDLVKRQRELNFPPGDDYLYSNTAYDLLATVVQRVSGKSIRQFAAERIFGPLGMERSQYLDDQSLLVPDRALGYSVAGGRISQNPAYVETVGSGSVYSTVDDMARWDESFYSASLGDQELLRLVQTPGRLNDGAQPSYAFGLMVDTWRGLRRVHHGGALAGYRATIVRFPDPHFSVIILCNLAQINPDAYAARIAEIYLAGQLGPAPRPAPAASVAFGDQGLAARAVGTYRSTRSGQVLRIERADSLLVLRFGPARLTLRAAGPDRAALIGQGMSGDESVQFEGSAAVATRLIVTGLDDRPQSFDRVEPASTTAAALAPLAGTYRSGELGIDWIVVVRDTVVVVQRPRGGDLTLEPVFKDGFTGGGMTITFERDRRGRAAVLRVTPGRSRNIRFDRLATT
jgi:CubicO group peptidase (beta-lactamase class C family)